jgi:Protein NO VEIN, C-terminal
LASNWSKDEVDLAIDDYMGMLSQELLGQKYNKTVHRNVLLPRLRNRTPGSVERKHQNISAVLIHFGLPYIIGYKPLGNYQALLAERVSVFLATQTGIVDVVGQSIDQPAQAVALSDPLAREVKPPTKKDYSYTRVRETGLQIRSPVRINYLEREARNSSLGKAGELFVVEFEKARLVKLGKGGLANSVEHVSDTQGDGLGFDVKSYDANGSDRLIEVKTTAGGKQTPFFVSRNEVDVSQEYETVYHLYRVFEYRKDPRMFMLQGALNRICALEAIQYLARVG